MTHSEQGLATASAMVLTDGKYLEGVQLTIVISSIIVASFLAFLDTAIIATAIPKITSDFHSLQDITWYGTAFQVASATIQPLVGKIYTEFGVKWVYVSFFVIFELGSVICGAAASSVMLIVGRAVSGIGAAGVITGSLTIIGTSIRPGKRATLMGAALACSSLGNVVGPLVGGALTEKASWRWCFYINLPPGVMVLAGLLFVTIDDQAPILRPQQILPTLYQKLDIVGFCLLAPAAVMLLLALQCDGTRYAWNSATIIGLFCGCAMTLLAFVAWEWHKGDLGLIPTGLCRNRIVIAGCFITFSVMGTSLLASYWLPIYFQVVKGESPVRSGVNLLPSILSGLFVAALTAFLIGKVGFYLPFAVTGGAVSAIGAGLLSTLHPRSSTGHWLGYQVVLGIGRGLAQQASFTAIPHGTTPKLVPIAMSMVIFSQYIGGSVLLSVSNVIFNTTLRTKLLQDAPGVDPELVIKAGAYALRNSGIPTQSLPAVLAAYCTSVDRVFYLAAASSGILFVSSFFSGWIDTRQTKDSSMQESTQESTHETEDEKTM